MRITIRQLKSLISETVRTSHVPSVKSHKSELARLKKIIKEEIEDAAEEKRVAPETKAAAALSPEEAKMELEEILRDAPPELLQKLEDLVSNPKFREIKSKLNEGDSKSSLQLRRIDEAQIRRSDVGTWGLGVGITGTSLAMLVGVVQTDGLFAIPGVSPAALLTVAGLLAAATIGGIVGVIKSRKADLY